MRRTKASLIYRRTKGLRSVQLLLGHTKLESTVRYFGIEVDAALKMAKQAEMPGVQQPIAACLLDLQPNICEQFIRTGVSRVTTNATSRGQSRCLVNSSRIHVCQSKKRSSKACRFTQLLKLSLPIKNIKTEVKDPAIKVGYQ
jgi:hypothetical protein